MAELGEEREWKVEPSVSSEKWILHAKRKLLRGYVLIVSPTRRNANFYLPGKGYEMCAYDIAKQLINHHAVVEAGPHYLGTVYRLSDDQAVASTPPRSTPTHSEAEEVTLPDSSEEWLDQLEEEIMLDEDDTGEDLTEEDDAGEDDN